jgi:hypothetical protein
MSTKPDLPFGVESDTGEAEKEEEAVPNTNCPGTKPLETAESLQPQGDKLAEVSYFSVRSIPYRFI